MSSMSAHFVRRALTTIPVILLVTMLLFALRTMTPGDPATLAIGQETDLNKAQYQ